MWLLLIWQSKLDGSLINRHNDRILSISAPAVEYRRRRQFAGNRTSVGMRKMLFAAKARPYRFGRAVQTPALVRRSAVVGAKNRQAPLARRVAERLQESRGSIADGRQYHRANGRIDMFRLVTIISSEVSAIVFAVYLGFFLFESPGFMPPLDVVMRDTFAFCGICVGYWWFQSGSLALSGASSAVRMATDILVSLIPIMVAGYAILDFWRGLLPLSEFKQYAAYFALSILILDVTFNAVIMFRLSRLYISGIAR